MNDIGGIYKKLERSQKELVRSFGTKNALSDELTSFSFLHTYLCTNGRKKVLALLVADLKKPEDDTDIKKLISMLDRNRVTIQTTDSQENSAKEKKDSLEG